MSEPFFTGVTEPIPYLGPDSATELSFKWYDADRLVNGKTMAEHLRFATAYWHSFNWDGFDIFGAGTMDRPWLVPGVDPMEAAKHKQDAAFEFFSKLGVPFYCFHDVDMVPAGNNFGEFTNNLNEMVERAGQKQEDTGVRLLWGTANMFSHPRFAAGAATNPDPEVFAYACAQVCNMLEATHKLGGANYVMWGGREGYETLLNTNMAQEAEQLARFMHLVVEHKQRLGFTGTLLIEPKPFEPTKHQYDYDSATVHAFLQKFDLASEIKLNIEVNHATLSGHDFEHEVSYAAANGILGSIDANAGDERLGWDVDRYPVSVEQMTLGMLEILKAGGLGTGGLNFDAKLRRQSVDRNDLFHAHIGGMDTMARSLLAAQSIIDSAELSNFMEQRYSGWSEPFGKELLTGKHSLPQLRERAATHAEPSPKSGRQEALENTVARHIASVR